MPDVAILGIAVLAFLIGVMAGYWMDAADAEKLASQLNKVNRDKEALQKSLETIHQPTIPEQPCV